MTADGAYPVFGANGIIGRYTRYNHEESEVLMTCRGATCGSINISEPRSWITGNAMVITPKDHRIEKPFLRRMIEFHPNKRSVISGSAQPQITRASLAPLTIPLPPLGEQYAIAARLDVEFSVSAELVQSLRAKLTELEKLPAALLREAFSPSCEVD
jgi:restriction endonuclease S subunit